MFLFTSFFSSVIWSIKSNQHIDRSQFLPGTCCTQPTPIRSPSLPFPQEQLLCCAFSPCGSLIVAGGNRGKTYMWSWQVLPNPQRRGPRTREQAAAGIPDTQEGPLAPQQWPEPTELCILHGHEKDISLVQFSHQGNELATASKDGTVRVSTLDFPTLSFGGPTWGWGGWSILCRAVAHACVWWWGGNLVCVAA